MTCVALLCDLVRTRASCRRSRARQVAIRHAQAQSVVISALLQRPAGSVIDRASFLVLRPRPRCTVLEQPLDHLMPKTDDDRHQHQCILQHIILNQQHHQQHVVPHDVDDDRIVLALDELIPYNNNDDSNDNLGGTAALEILTAADNDFRQQNNDDSNDNLGGQQQTVEDLAENLAEDGHPHDQVDFAQPIVIALNELVLRLRQRCEPACKNVSVQNHPKQSYIMGVEDVSAQTQQQQHTVQDLAENLAEDGHPHDKVDCAQPIVIALDELILHTGKNDQHQLCEPACKNVSVQNHPRQPYMMGAEDVSAQNQHNDDSDNLGGTAAPEILTAADNDFRQQNNDDSNDNLGGQQQTVEDLAENLAEDGHPHDQVDFAQPIVIALDELILHSGKNHQHQLCEPACKNVSVQNHPRQSYIMGAEDVSAQNQQQQQFVVDLVENLAEDGYGVEDVSAWAWRGKRLGVEVLKLLMSDVRACRCALAQLLHARGARDMLAHNQSQPPLVFDLADLVVGGVHDVGDVSAQTEQQRALSGLRTFRKTWENNQVRPGQDQGLLKQCLCAVHVVLDDLMYDVVLSREVEVHDTIATKLYIGSYFRRT